MSQLAFDVRDVTADRFAAAPTLRFRLRVSETTGARVHALALRAQIRIEPQRRRYRAEEETALFDLFGPTGQWGDTLRPLQFAFWSMVCPGFTGSTDVDMVVPCSYDLEVAAGRYFQSLADGVVPLLLLFSGTVFLAGERGFLVEQVPWDKEATWPLPVAVWRQMIDQHFPQSGWLRLHRDTLAALARFKARAVLPTWDDAVLALLDAAEQGVPRCAP